MVFVARIVLLGLVLLAVGCGLAGEPEFDVLLAGGTIVDGTGDESYLADVGIRDGQIASIGDLSGSTAAETLDVAGLVVAPGFIDVHNHADRGLRDPRLKTNKGFVTQGVTTCVFGVDGGWSLESMREALQLFEEQGVGTNFAFYIGHNGVRRAVMGMEDRAPTDDELEQMRTMVREAMEAGALGLSTGLMYLPGNFGTTDEVVALAKVAAEFGGLYDSHVRDPANNLIASHAEAIEIAERAGAVPHPGHVKAVGMKNFGKGPEFVELIEDARGRGLDVTVDQYPYDGAATAKLISILVPPDDLGLDQLLEGFVQEEDPEVRDAGLRAYVDAFKRHLGDDTTRARIRQMTEEPPAGVFSWVDAVGYSSYRIVVTETERWLDRMLVDVAEEEGVSPFDLMVRMILDEGAHPMVTLGAIPEEDVRIIMRQPWTMISSDGAITGFEAGGGHPRSRGSFPRVLGRYVREWGVLTLEDAVRKLTALPASYLRIKDRGTIIEGKAADLTVFDPATIIDRSTWAEPSLFSEGIVHVFVNGRSVLKSGQMTGETPGRFLPFSGKLN